MNFIGIHKHLQAFNWRSGTFQSVVTALCNLCNDRYSWQPDWGSIGDVYWRCLGSAVVTQATSGELSTQCPGLN